MMRLCAAFAFVLAVLSASPARASSSNCDPDGVQASGSIYRICMPAPENDNHILVIWAHGFQDAGTPVAIPEDQLCIGTFCLDQVITSLGFRFATNSYSKTGLAILQGKDDILDLVNIYTALKGAPLKVYIVGASEGGIITALSVEQRPDVYSAGLAACGPIGDFPLQINYLGDARATFEVFFHGLIPGTPFNPDPAVVPVWADYYETHVKPVVFDPANRWRLDQWVNVAHLPYDANDYLNTVEVSVQDVLRYFVVDLADAAATLDGFPFDNSKRYYTGTGTAFGDFLLNLSVPRATASSDAVANMKNYYNTTGILTRPLITLHTTRDQQVPFIHEPLYNLKTLASGSLLTRHLLIPIDRFEHCNFTPSEVLASFAVMLFYDGAIPDVSGINTSLTPQQISTALAAKLRPTQ